MKINILKVINGIVFFALILLNLYIYINRDNGYTYIDFLTYGELYPPEGDLLIKKVNFNNKDSIFIELTGSLSDKIIQFKILLPDSSVYICENTPRIKLIEGIHSYSILNEKSDLLFELTLNFVKSSSYMLNDRKRDSDVELMYSSIPFQNEKQFEKQHWKQSSQYTTKTELNQAKKLLKDSVKILKTDHTIVKVEKISHFLLKTLDSKRGIPKDTMEYLSPMKRFEFAIENKSNVWCGDFSSIFAFFAEAAGITTRLIWIDGNQNGINMAGHSFNEVYIDELHKWIFLDLTSKAIGVQSNEGEYLNTIEFYNAFLLKSKNVHLNTIKDNNFIQDSIIFSQTFYQHYFNRNINFRFYYSSQFSENLYGFYKKIARYVSEKPTYGIYSNTIPQNNSKFYLKKYAFWSLIFFSIYLLLLKLTKYLKKKGTI